MLRGGRRATLTQARILTETIGGGTQRLQHLLRHTRTPDDSLARLTPSVLNLVELGRCTLVDVA